MSKKIQVSFLNKLLNLISIFIFKQERGTQNLRIILLLLFLKQVSFCAPGWSSHAASCSSGVTGMVLHSKLPESSSNSAKLWLSQRNQSLFAHYSATFETFEQNSSFRQMRLTYTFSAIGEVIQTKWKPLCLY